MVGNPDGTDVALRMWREGYEVGLAQGLQPGEGARRRGGGARGGDEAALATAMEGHGATYASMLQDLERGAPTEVDVIDGAVVERAHELGLQAPANAQVVELVHAYERGELSPSPDHFERVATAA